MRTEATHFMIGKTCFRNDGEQDQTNCLKPQDWHSSLRNPNIYVLHIDSNCEYAHIHLDLPEKQLVYIIETPSHHSLWPLQSIEAVISNPCMLLLSSGVHHIIKSFLDQTGHVIINKGSRVFCVPKVYLNAIPILTL